MNKLPERILHLWRATALGLALTLLASCGPGTGGTGTGPISFSGGSGSASSVPIATGAATAPACTACTRVDLRLEEGRVELLLPCGRFLFTGPWRSEASQLSLAGTFQNTSAGTTAPATLRLQFARAGADSDSVVATLVDSADTSLLRVTLQRREGAPPADACSP